MTGMAPATSPGPIGTHGTSGPSRWAPAGCPTTGAWGVATSAGQGRRTRAADGLHARSNAAGEQFPAGGAGLRAVRGGPEVNLVLVLPGLLEKVDDVLDAIKVVQLIENPSGTREVKVLGEVRSICSGLMSSSFAGSPRLMKQLG